MQAFEVTQGEYTGLTSKAPLRFQECGGECPVTNVSWLDAISYANALSRVQGLEECYTEKGFQGISCPGYRLPTEAEWEYAVRAGSRGATYGELKDIAWFAENSLQQIHPVGQKRANAFGLYDMIGNVREWVNDIYGPYETVVVDPMGSSSGRTFVVRGGSSGRTFVVRGGSWMSGAASSRSAYRNHHSSDLSSSSIGFRLVKAVP